MVKKSIKKTKKKINKNNLSIFLFTLLTLLFLAHSPLRADEALYSKKAVWAAFVDETDQPQFQCRLPITDAKQLITTFDRAMRPTTRQLVDCDDEPLYTEEIGYDASGNSDSQRIFYGYSAAPQTEINRTFDEKNNVTSLSFKQEGLPLRQIDYCYDQEGRLQQLVKADGVTLQLAYTAEGKLDRIYSSDATLDYLYSYDAIGKPILAENGLTGDRYRRHYSSEGRLAKEEIAGKASVLFEYDDQGSLIRTKLPDGSAILREYQEGVIKRIVRLSQEGAALYSQTFEEKDDLDRPIKVEMIGDLGPLEYGYDQEGGLNFIKSAFQNEEYQQKSAKEIELKRAIFSDEQAAVETTIYTYDNKEFILKEQQQGQKAITYSYDETNSPLIEGLSVVRDANGNAVQLYLPNGHHLSCRYDALNRLIEVVADERTRTLYGWDGWGRRISKRVEELQPANPHGEETWVVVEELTYLFEQGKEIGAINKEGDLIYLRLAASGPTTADHAAAIEANGRLFCPIHDVRGNLCGLIDPSTREIAQQYAYTAFGQERQQNANYDKNSPWRFAGKWTEEESGVICFGARFYHPLLRQWLSEDPLGYLDGWQRTIYAHNDPIRYTDPTGELSISLSLKKAWQDTCCLYERATEGIGSFIKKPIDTIAEKSFGKDLLTIAGYYQDLPEAGVYGNGEISDQVRITSINGVLNTRESLNETLELLSSTHAGVNIHYVFRPTTGIIGDLSDAFAMRIFGQSSLYAELLAETWRQLIEEMGGVGKGGTIIHYAHSLGGADTYAASKLMTAEEKRMIHIITIGTAKVIPQTTGFHHVVNYASCNDGIPWLSDPSGYLKGLFGASSHMLEELSSTSCLPFIEHLWAKGPYRELMHIMGEQFSKRFMPQS